MNAEQTGLSPTETEKIRAGLEQCILTLDNTNRSLGETEQRLRKHLVRLHSEIEKIDINSRHPFVERD